MAKTILWCTGHYTNEFCKLKAKELRQKVKDGDPDYSNYSGVRIVDKVIDYASNNELKQFNRIRLVLR